MELEKTANQAELKAWSRTVVRLRQAWSDVQVLVRLSRAFARGEYREVSRGTIGLILGALVYFVSPIDAILDHLPLAGYLDDAAILAWVVRGARRGRGLPPVGGPQQEPGAARRAVATKASPA